MCRFVHRLAIVLLVAVVASGCGGHSTRLADGAWYGKIETVDVRLRRMVFVPACRFSDGRWIRVRSTGGAQATVAISPYAELGIYFHPGGTAAAGHMQAVGLEVLAQVASSGHRPDFPPGWFVKARRGAATSVQEDSGIRPSANVSACAAT